MSKQIASVLNLRQEWPPVLCERKVSAIGDEQVRCVASLLTVGVRELYCERLLFVLENILVEDQMLDEVTLKARFITRAARRSIISHQAGDAPIVCPDLSNRHSLSSPLASSDCGPLSLNVIEICSSSRTLPRTSPFVQQNLFRPVSRRWDRILGVSSLIKTVRIVFCKIRNHSHRLLYVFASTSVKKARSGPFQSHSLLKLTSLLDSDDMERSEIRPSP